MNKTKLVAAVANTTGLPKTKVEEVITAIFGESGALEKSLSKGNEIALHGFGTFRVKKRKARMAHNPQTGAKVEVPARKVVVFKPGERLRKSVA
jgi:DNA-binding protein HU-beta